jgi:predicted  nucleic acid-binding Zn-ribbon protein
MKQVLDNKGEKIYNKKGEKTMFKIKRKHLLLGILLLTVTMLLMQLVKANPISVGIAPTQGSIGTYVNVSGIADTQGGTVNIYFDIDGDGLTEPEEFQTSTTADVNTPYAYVANLIVPASPAGTHAIIVNDVDAGSSAGAFFTVTPSIAISPESGPIGTIVTVTGAGFDSNSMVTITLDSVDVTPATTPQTDEFGSFSATFAVPPALEEVYTITAIDAALNSASSTFTLLGITILLNPTSGSVGALVTITGMQATPSGLVTISWDTSEIVTVTAGTDGSYSYDLTVPASQVGQHTIEVEDSESLNTASEIFVVQPEITLNIEEGPIGTEITVTGTGFVADAYVDIAYDTSLAVDDFSTDATGSFVATFTVPPSVAGIHTVTATDSSDSSVASDATFAVIPAIAISAIEGSIGSEVTITGTGFADTSSVTYMFEGIDVTPPSAPITDESGSFSASFVVPSISAGTHTVSITDEDANTASVDFTVWSITISINPTTGMVGTSVSISGAYATPDGTLTIKWNGATLGTTEAAADGTYTYELMVPASTFGEHTITVIDEDSTNNAVDTFTVESRITLNPPDGLVGDAITVLGTGFSGSSTADVYFDKDRDGVLDPEDLMLADVPTDENGSFSTTFNAPSVPKAGNYLITAIDEEAVTSDATFTVLFVMWTPNTEYFQGDYPSFYIQVVDENGEPFEMQAIVVTVTDSAGNIQYKGITFSSEDGTTPYDTQFFNFFLWDNLDTLQLVPFHLSSDASTGSWTWTATANGLTVNGSFDTVEPVDLRTLLDKLNQLLEGQDDIGDLVTHYGEKLQLDHEELAELTIAVSDELQLDHDALASLINEVVQNLQLDHEAIIALTTDIASNLGLKLDDLETFVSDLAIELQMEHEEISDLISGLAEQLQLTGDNLASVIGEVAETLQMEHSDIIELISSVSEQLNMNHEELAGLVSQVFEAMEIKLDDIVDGIIEIEAKVDGLYATIGSLEVKLDDIQAKLVDIKNDLATISTTLGVIQTKVDNIGTISLEEIKADIATIRSDIGTIKVNVSNINANITAVKGRIATIETSVGTIQADIDAINGKLETLDGTTATIKTDIGTIKVSLTDLNSKIAVVNNNEATIQTDVGTIKGRLTAIEDDMATIETDVGTVKTSAQSIETTSGSIKSDTTWQPSTVVLSLIAAIAAIAAAVMVLRKVYTK